MCKVILSLSLAPAQSSAGAGLVTGANDSLLLSSEVQSFQVGFSSLLT